MKVIVGNEKEISQMIADEFIKVVKNKPNAVLGLATGTSPLLVYADMAKAYKDGEVSFKDCKSFNLDEYVGLEGTHDQSYRYFMTENLFKHIDISEAMAISLSMSQAPHLIPLPMRLSSLSRPSKTIPVSSTISAKSQPAPSRWALLPS